MPARSADTSSARAPALIIMEETTMSCSMEILHLLKDIAGENHVYAGESIGQDYTHDECASVSGTPDAVVEAADTESVSAVMKLCAERAVPVTVRGAGTGQAGGCVAVNGGVVLSLKNMNRVLSYDEHAGTLTVQPGVLLQDVKAEAEAHGKYYPPDPGEQTATIGGNAATDAGGPCAVKYGSTRSYVADAVIVLADGSAVRLGDRPEYASVIGGEGALGVITELTLRLADKPKAQTILLLPFMDAESCIAAGLKLRAHEPAGLEYMDTDMVEYAGRVTGNPVFPVKLDGERVGATLMLTLEGESEDALDEELEAIAEEAEELECLDILVVDTPTLKRDAAAAYAAFHTSTETAPGHGEVNVTLPPEQVAAYAAFAKEQGEAAGLTVLSYAHIGSGGVHVHAVSELPRAEFEPKFAALAASLYEKCAALGGDTAGEYGVGCAKKAYLGEEKRAAFKAAKAALDPRGILNPGKVAD